MKSGDDKKVTIDLLAAAKKSIRYRLKDNFKSRDARASKNDFCHNNAVSDGWGAPANNYHPKWGPESYAADASYKRGPRQHRSDLAPERQCCAANYACVGKHA